MRRREFMGLVGGAAAWPLAARGQQITVRKLPKIGVLWTPGDNDRSADFVMLIKSFGELGYTPNKNVAFLHLFPSDQADYQTLVHKLIEDKVDVIFAANYWASMWAMNSTLEIPVVGIFQNSLSQDQFAKSLSHPGGNVTGLTLTTDDLTSKRVAFLKEAVPNLARLTILFDRRNPDAPGKVPPTVFTHRQAAEDLGLSLQPIETATVDDVAQALTGLRHDGTDGVAVSPQLMFYRERASIATIAMAQRIPTIATNSQSVRDGLLMSYGPDFAEYLRKAASYVDKILKGAKPSELPIEQPTRLKLAINLRTAKAIELAMPPTLLATADEVIE
jgi:putative tryptophan/tyrosine transport system substrate-binding protein